MYIERLKFENLRTFEQAEIEWNYPGRPLGPVAFDNVNLLLGDNASGKTTVLKAVALGALAPVLGGSSGFVPYSLVRRPQSFGSGETAFGSVAARLFLAELDERADEKLKLYSTKRGFSDRVWDTPVGTRLGPPLWDSETDFLMVGYGASRRVEFDAEISDSARSKSRFFRYRRTAGLFEEGITLVPLSNWFLRVGFGELSARRRVGPERLREARTLLNEVLAPQACISEEFVGEEVVVEVNNGTAVPVSALSDGYRAFLGWTSDLLYHLVAATPDNRALRDQSGIVLVDEIDLHLHPEWQQRVIPTVARTFPNLQFIFTSHSPLVVGSLRQANVFVLERDERGVSQIRPSPSEVYGLSADQILTSEHFGLRSTRASGFVEQLEQKALEARRGDADAAIEFLDMVTLGAAADPVSLGRPEATRKKS
jgi:AAA domain, putative AbiEii toxin, Type IV TA system